MAAAIDIADPALWTLPLHERMALLGELREAASFTRAWAVRRG